MFVVSVSLALIAGILLVVYGLQFGIDFKGGSVLEVTFRGERPAPEVLQEALEGLPDIEAISEVQLTPVGEQGVLMRSGPLTEEDHREVLGAFSAATDGEVIEESFESIGPAIGSELRTKSIRAIVILILVVVVYIALVFRGMSRTLSPWAMGLAALVALFHDLIIPMGVFAILGNIQGIQITAVFVAAVLTILGYSLSDTVVVFDRVRENLLRGSTEQFPALVHMSVKQTLVRSLNTTATTLAALIAIWFFGGESLKYFSLALIIGIALGSYSSIFVASPLLVWFSRNRE